MFQLNQRYEVLKRLGEGAQGKVFLCRDTKTKQECAVKVAPFDTSQQLNTAMNECITISQLKHDHIVPCLECFVVEDHPYVSSALCQVMPYYPMGDLAHFLEERAEHQIPQDVIVHILRQLAQALLVVHDRKIVHRDLKPENILIEYFAQDKYPHVILADFGLCKMVQQSQQQTMVGTVFYVAPEVLLNKPYSWSADIYSLGVVVHYLMTRKVCNILVEKTIKGETAWIKDKKETLSEHYDPWLLQLVFEDMLHTNAKSRPSCKEILDKLSAAGNEFAAALRRFGAHSLMVANKNVTTRVSNKAIIITDDDIPVALHKK